VTIKGEIILMSQKAQNIFGINQKEYQQMVERKKARPSLAKNVLIAFLAGGLLAFVGQLIMNFFVGLGFSSQEAADPMIAIFIFLGALATGLGVFDKISHYTGAGTAIPVTGFANSITSAALEFKREGLVRGVGSKMFLLAGSVIVFGVVTALVIGLISAII